MGTPITLLADALLPERTGYLLFTTALGLFGGGVASVFYAVVARPKLWNLTRHTIVGGFAALVVAFLFAWKAPAELFLAYACCALAGFLGPIGTWKVLAAYQSAVPRPPPPQNGEYP